MNKLEHRHQHIHINQNKYNSEVKANIPPDPKPALVVVGQVVPGQKYAAQELDQAKNLHPD